MIQEPDRERGGGMKVTKRRLMTPTSMGRANKARVLELLHVQGPSSRAQIARELNVNRATVATIVQPLLDDGTLVEGPAVAPSDLGGKPARPLWFRYDGLGLGGMRVAPNEVSAAHMRMDGSIVRTVRRSIRPRSSRTLFDRTIREVAAECFAGQRLLGVGVGASGMVDTTSGRVISLHLAPALNGFGIAAALEDELSVPISVDHHPRVQALGDRWFGRGKGLSSFASVYTGEALGFGIVHDGQTLAGPDGAGGESGHTVVDMNGEACVCGRRGCWETVATLGWLRRQAGQRGLRGAQHLTCGRLAALSSESTAAADLLDEYARNLAVGMANNEQVVASGAYIMHGDVVAGGERMQERLQHWLDQSGPHRGPVPVLMADTPDHMTLLGGGGLVLSTALVTSA